MGNTSSYCSAVYANPHIHRRKEMCGDLIRISNMIHGPWIVLGDFNDVLLQSEVIGDSLDLPEQNNLRKHWRIVGCLIWGLLGEDSLGTGRCKMADRATKGHRPFRFQAAWMTHPLFRNVVHIAWNKGAPDVVKCLLEVQKDATSFNKKTVIRRKRNKIHGLFLEDGSWAIETSTLEMAANSFFQKLFSTREDIDLDAMGNFPCPSLSTEAYQKLVEPVTS
ncbi:uncharacterized protein LOC107620436 [Arachis ipaensis]|uniref:uncharacterized protein LOC107620436 n=1 Tax=Arachis ipaensis TaxID=130454 RepID=UPI0007AF1E9B|nr:uncharacterized protein LOC107620436 [Arachis ipaensis]